ncbi:MAG: decaprenylphospho-beta-D-erythro-pentofuranosid-2-ulose 2-reductase [Gaiellaceae bacterium]
MMDALGRFGTVLVLGGGSDIAAALLRRLLREGPLTAILAARRPEKLETEELEALGATVERMVFDARDAASHAGAIGEVFDRGDVDLALVAFGLLGDQEEAEREPAEAVAVAETNFVGAVSALTVLSDRMRAQGRGAIVVLSSIAGQRARRSNYVYGASKAGLDAFCQGLQLALEGSGVRLVIVRPGFVRTKMTAGMRPAPLSVGPDQVGEAIVQGVRRGDGVIWVPPALRLLAVALRAAPARLLKGL